MTDEWWSADQVAERLQISVQSVYTYHASGRLPAPDRYFGRTPVWRPATIETYIKTLRPPARVLRAVRETTTQEDVT